MGPTRPCWRWRRRRSRYGAWLDLGRGLQTWHILGLCVCTTAGGGRQVVGSFFASPASFSHATCSQQSMTQQPVPGPGEAYGSGGTGGGRQEAARRCVRCLVSWCLFVHTHLLAFFLLCNTTHAHLLSLTHAMHTHHAKPTEAFGLLKPTAPSPAAQDNDTTTSADNKTDLLKSLINNTSAGATEEEGGKVVAAVELDAEGAQLPMLLELAKGQRILSRALVALPPQQVSGGRGKRVMGLDVCVYACMCAPAKTHSYTRQKLILPLSYVYRRTASWPPCWACSLPARPRRRPRNKGRCVRRKLGGNNGAVQLLL